MGKHDIPGYTRHTGILGQTWVHRVNRVYRVYSINRVNMGKQDIYLLLAEFSVRTVNYGPSFFPSI